MKRRRLKPIVKFVIALVLMFAGMAIQADGYLDTVSSETAAVEAIMISGPKFNELQHVEIKNGIPGDNSEPEFFKERRNYIHGRA